MQAGIYILTSPSNKIYVGQSWNFKERMKKYKYGDTKKQPALHASIKKYGWVAHTFEIILSLSLDTSQTWMDYWEQFFMNYYRSQGYKLMNIRNAGSRGKQNQDTKDKIRNSLTGVPHSKERREKESKAHIGLQSGKNHYLFGKKRPKEVGEKVAKANRGRFAGEKHFNARPIMQFTKSGEFVREWGYVNGPTKELGINNISRACAGNNKEAGGYIWKYKKTIAELAI